MVKLNMENLFLIKPVDCRTVALSYGKSLLQFEGAISADDLQLMAKAIDENCEKVETSEW